MKICLAGDELLHVGRQTNRYINRETEGKTAMESERSNFAIFLTRLKIRFYKHL